MNKGRKHRRGGKGRHKGKGEGGGGGGDAQTTAEDDVEDQTCPESPAGQSQPSSSTAGDDQCNKEGEKQDNKQENTQGNHDDKQDGIQSDPQCNKQSDDQDEKNDKQCNKQGSKQGKKRGKKEGNKQDNMQGEKQVEMQAGKESDTQISNQESMQGDEQGSKEDSKQGNKQDTKQGNKQDKKQRNKQRNNQDGKQGDEDRKQDSIQFDEQGNKQESKHGDKRNSKQSNKQNGEQGNKQGKKQDIKQGNRQSNKQDSMQGDKHSNKQSSQQSSQQGSPPLQDDPEAVGDLRLPPLDQRCYVVKKSDVMGRYLVASRDLEAGELIMEEEPLVVGPSQTFKPFCIGCYQPLYEQQPYRAVSLCGDAWSAARVPRCASCGWPLCGSACVGAGHCASECAAWAAAGLRQRPPPSPLAYQAVMALRCLLLRDADPTRWHKLRQMESHDAIRRALPELWRHNQAVIVERIRCDWGLAERFSEDEAHSICGILEVNAFEVGQHGTRALYPTAFLLAHDCVPNTAHSDHPRSFALRVRAASPVRAGQPLTLSYAYTLQGTQKRREHLHESKFFWCGCARCADPTELGSMASALRCPKCEQGFVLPGAPLAPDAPWACGRCGFALDAASVGLLVDRMSDDLESTDANSVEALEGFLRKYGHALHPQHYLSLSAKHSLAQLYGKAEGYTIHELTQAQLQRKRDLCLELLGVFDVLEPGLSRLRGVCLYELHAPIMILATRGFEARALAPSQLAQQLREVERCLREAARILQLEPEGSSERDMGAAAADALARMQDWHRVLAAL